MGYSPNQLRVIAQEMLVEADRLELHPRDPGATRDIDLVRLADAERARRRVRDLIMPPGILGEPAWDMLIELYRAHCKSPCVAARALASAAAVPSATAFRWFGVLEEEGLVTRIEEPGSADGPFVKLSSIGRMTIETILRSWSGTDCDRGSVLPSDPRGP